MDAYCRKRKMVELDKNITPSVGPVYYPKTSNKIVELDYRVVNKCQKIRSSHILKTSSGQTNETARSYSTDDRLTQVTKMLDDSDEEERESGICSTSSSSDSVQSHVCPCKNYQWSGVYGKPTFSTDDSAVVNPVRDQLTSAMETISESGDNGRQDVGFRAMAYRGGKNTQSEVCDNDRKDARMWFSTDYIEDIVSHEIYKESLYQLSENFCRKYDINPTGREILIDWLINVQVHLKAENSTLHLAVALLDIMLDSIHIPLHELQAAAVAAFWVAYKFIHGNLSVKTLMNLCAGSVTKEMIEDHEILVIQTSRLIQAGGSLTVFFNYLLFKLFGFKFPPEIYYCGLYFIEIMLLQFVFVDCPAYEKAVTAVFTALTVFDSSARFEVVEFTRFITKRKLQHIYRRLLRLLRLMYNDKEALKNSSVFRKYKSSRYMKISVHNNLKAFATA